jgi:hypothetical protein
MMKSSLIAVLTTVCISPLALADHEPVYGPGASPAAFGCEAAKRDQQTAGALLGAVAGGLLGAAIADDNGNHAHHRHRRHHGHYRHYRHHGPSSGDQVAGAVIGGVLGAVIGSEVARSNVDCTPKWDHRATPPPTRVAEGPAWNAPARTADYGNPPRSVVYSNEPPAPLLGGPDDPSALIAQGRPEPLDPAEAGAGKDTCQTIQRETLLSNGTRLREPVQICQDTQGHWILDETPFS